MKKIWFFFFGILIFFTLAAVFLKSDFWDVAKVSCQLDHQPCPAEIWAQAMSLGVHQNLIFLSSSALAKELAQQIPVVEEVKVFKRYFHELVIEMTKRKAVAAIKFSGTDEWGIFDQAGVFLAKDAIDDLPQILAPTTAPLTVGQSLTEPAFLKALPFLAQMPLYLWQTETAAIISATSFKVKLKNGPEVWFSLNKAVTAQLDSLQVIMMETKMEDGVLEKIDLRFDKPVLTYQI